MPTSAYAVFSARSPLGPHVIERREVGPNDVAIRILYCGICFTDLHVAHGTLGPTQYPCVPGHEIVGTVTAVGPEVTRFRSGDRVGVGCMVDSCGECENCRSGDEQYCAKGCTATYNAPDRCSGGVTYGGYSTAVVVNQDFVLRIPDALPMAETAPLLCAGITTYSPLKRWGAGPGKRVGIIGLGGLGHVGVKIARALGAHVTMITTSPHKAGDAARLGAHAVLLSTDAEAMERAQKSFNIVLNTGAYLRDVGRYTSLLRKDGVQVLLSGSPPPLPGLDALQLIFSRTALAGSNIGGIAETQEMLDFCAEHGITSDIELVTMEGVNAAWERLERSDVKYRFVIDVGAYAGSA